MGLVADRYNAACSWAQANQPDSAFHQLYRIVRTGNFADDQSLEADTDLIPLHQDERWKIIIDLAVENKLKQLIQAEPATGQKVH